MSTIRKNKKRITDLIIKVKKKDFSGNTGIAVRNSIYQTMNNVVAKIGSLIFTILIARLLLPELFGLYSLALSTVLVFSAVSSLGIGETLITFVSRELSKNNQRKAKAYTIYFGKLKFVLVLLSMSVLLLSARFLSNVYYQKPLFLALIAGSLYILSFETVTFLGFLFQASNSFKRIFEKEIIFQVFRSIFIPIIIFFSIKYSLSDEKVLFYIILLLSVSYLFTALFMMFISKKEFLFLHSKKQNLTQKEKKAANKFLSVTAVLFFSGMFFSYIDKIMLGRFVAAEFIGYYSLSMGLMGSLSSLVGFGSVLLPVFSRMKGEQLEGGLKKSIKVTLLMGTALFVGTLLFANFIPILFGTAYTQSVNLLRFFSIIMVPLPLIGIYASYFMSKGNPWIVAKFLIISTVINVILNYSLITYLIRYGNLAAVYGAGIAAIVSQFFYLFGLVFSKPKD